MSPKQKHIVQSVSESDKVNSASSEESKEEEENSSSDSKQENLRDLLKPFTKDQLIKILKTAYNSNPESVSTIIFAADSDPVQRKVFVHGLPWNTTTETLLKGFEPYGEIEECNVVKDKGTGNCKGYGFVLFKGRDGAGRAIKDRNIRVGGRMVLCQLASIGGGEDVGSRKLFVGNVGPGVDPDKLLAFFWRFGEIEVGPIGMDRVTGKFRGFAKFVYKSVDGVKKALEEPTKVFDGCVLKCSIAQDVSKKGGGGISGDGNDVIVGEGSNIQLSSLAMGLNPGMVAQSLNPNTVLLPQNVSDLNKGLGTGSVLSPISLVNPALLGSLGGGLQGLRGTESASSQVERRTPLDATRDSNAVGGYGSPAGMHNIGALGCGMQAFYGMGSTSSVGAAYDANAIGDFGSQVHLGSQGALRGGVQALNGSISAYSWEELKMTNDARVGSNVIGSFGSQMSLHDLGLLGGGMEVLNGVGSAPSRGESRTGFDARLGPNAIRSFDSHSRLENLGAYRAFQLDQLPAFTRTTTADAALPKGSYSSSTTNFPSAFR